MKRVIFMLSMFAALGSYLAFGQPSGTLPQPRQEGIINGVALTMLDNPALPREYAGVNRPHTGIRIRPFDPTISGEKITVVIHNSNGYGTVIMEQPWNNSQLYVDFLIWCAPEDIMSITVDELHPTAARFTR